MAEKLKAFKQNKRIVNGEVIIESSKQRNPIGVGLAQIKSDQAQETNIFN